MKKVLISFFVLVFIISTISFVNAATSGTATLKLSQDTVKVGDEFYVIMTAADENNLNTVEYNNVTITDANGNKVDDSIIKLKEVSSNWNKMEENSIKYFVNTGDAVKEAEVAKFVLLVGDNATEGTYTIKIETIKVHNAKMSVIEDEEITVVGDKSVQVKVVKDNTTAGNNGQNQEQEGQKTEEPKNETPNSSNGSSNNNGSTTSGSSSNNGNSKKIPQTGIMDSGIVIMGLVIGLGIISYISYRKYKNI